MRWTLYIILFFCLLGNASAQNPDLESLPPEVIQEFQFSQPGMYSGQNQQEEYYIHREPHRDYPEYQLYLLCPYKKVKGSENEYLLFNNMDIYNHRTRTFFDHNGNMRTIDAKGINCIHIIGNGWILIDPSAYPVFSQDQAHGALSLTSQVAISMIPATYVGRLVFTGAQYGFQVAGGVTLGSNAITVGATVLTAGTTEYLSFLLIEQINDLMNQASDSLDRPWYQRLSYRYLTADADITEAPYVVGDGIEKTEFSSNEKVTLGDKVRVIDVASKLYCYFNSKDCLIGQKKYLHSTPMNQELCNGEANTCDLPFIKLWFDVEQYNDDMPSMDPELQRKISTCVGLGPCIGY
ncbi:MAG TPA: hypothetical protein PKC21_02445 [Oligoflexia bacterium]|nr:hypothetical protein [Oligoflexia bacterium]HMR24191.1 hypothetical protein [Oligoflexia bacterium]